VEPAACAGGWRRGGEYGGLGAARLGRGRRERVHATQACGKRYSRSKQSSAQEQHGKAGVHGSGSDMEE
jgi:hypothetical protein